MIIAKIFQIENCRVNVIFFFNHHFFLIMHLIYTLLDGSNWFYQWMEKCGPMTKTSGILKVYTEQLDGWHLSVCPVKTNVTSCGTIKKIIWSNYVTSAWENCHLWNVSPSLSRLLVFNGFSLLSSLVHYVPCLDFF